MTIVPKNSFLYIDYAVICDTVLITSSKTWSVQRLVPTTRRKTVFMCAAGLDIFKNLQRQENDWKYSRKSIHVKSEIKLYLKKKKKHKSFNRTFLIRQNKTKCPNFRGNPENGRVCTDLIFRLQRSLSLVQATVDLEKKKKKRCLTHADIQKNL